jgi:hypothetical protein
LERNKLIEQQFIQKQIGHFTAGITLIIMHLNFPRLVVWKDTKKVGISYAKSDKGAYFVVANYFPAGNIINKVSQNIQV